MPLLPRPFSSVLRIGTTLAAAAILHWPGVARAVLGVEDDRSSLPEGPGSVNGFADNADVGVATGAMSYTLPFDLPEGFPSATPGLALAYNSNGGNGPFGMGWDIAIPSIERGTVMGLPVYTTADAFFANGSDQLVRVDSGADPATFEYRARFEGSFVRYRWHAPAMAMASGDYWTAELPDGTIQYYGADSTGAVDTLAREEDTRGTFRYRIVESADPFGHRVHYTWKEPVPASISGRAMESVVRPVLASIEYAFKADGTPRHKVTFDYEVRPDIVSDCKAGFCVYLDQRTTAINVFTNATKIRSYELAYDPTPVASPLTRLRGMKTRGKDGTVLPAAFSFDYTQALGVDCKANDCGMPTLTSIGGDALGTDVKNGQLSLVDINGDALPDGLWTDPASGTHTFFISQLVGGKQTFVKKQSALTGISGFMLGGAGHTQLVDIDGDGFVDLVDLTQNKLLRNRGTGDWTGIESITAGAGSAQVATQQIGGGELTDSVFNDDDVVPGYMRFLDVDNDKVSDLIQATVGNTPLYYRNLGAKGFAAGVPLAPIVPGNAFGFDNNGTQLADINGDGLQDAVWVIPGSPGQMAYVLNLGNGAFSKTQLGFALPAAIDASAVNRISFEDLNGDDLNDVVLVASTTLSYAININGAQFGTWQTLTSVGGTALPDANVQTPLYADMNGNGSTDVVWFSADGHVQYVDLFPQRPFLLSEVRNGLGKIVDVVYTTTVDESSRAESPWDHRLLHPNTMVTSLDDWDDQSKLHDLTSYRYRNAYYSGTDRQFRGFEVIETRSGGDATQEDGLSVNTYDLGIPVAGVSDEYHRGLLKTATESSGGRVLSTTTNTFADCPLDGLPAQGTLTVPVRYICKTATEAVKQEGAPAADWATTRAEYTYDGYGQATKVANLGVVKIGGGACGACAAGAGDYGQACGSTCTGDEATTESVFVAPGSAMGAWLLGRPQSVRTYADASSATYTETLTFYDGNPFEGLAAGKLTKGLVSRVQSLKEAGSYITEARNRYDAHGNLIEQISPLGQPDGPAHRRIWAYDADGLELTRTALLVDSSTGAYQLWRDYTYEPYFTNTASYTNWYVATGATVSNGVISGGQAEGAVLTTSFTFDEFGRHTAIIEPGDAPATPSETYDYAIGAPLSSITARGRGTRNGAQDAETVQCYDGHSRLYQERTRLGDGKYSVTGYTVFNQRKEPVRVYEPYTAASAACDTTEPTDVPKVTYLRDAASRPLTVTRSDASVFGTASATKHEYLPLARADYDAEDTDPKSPGFDTPTIRRMDGLGRVVAVDRYAKADGPATTHKIVYDGLGNFRGYVDPEGNRRVQDFDRMGRLLRVQDPVRGARVYTYDDDGNLTSETDGRNIKTDYSYDGINRLSASWKDGDEAATKVEYTHDRAGTCAAETCTNLGARLAGVTYPLDGGEHGQDFFGYDDRGNKTRLGRTIGKQTFAFTYAFDNLRRATGTTYPNGKTLPYTLDAAGRVTAIGDYIKSVTYDDRGDARTMAYGNGVKTTYEHDPLRQLHRLTVSDADGTPLVDLTNDRDRDGHVVKVTDAVVDPKRPSHGATFTYDALERLTGAVLDGDRADFREELTFEHSPAGNLTSKVSSLGDKSPAHVGKYTYDTTSTHKLLSAGAYTLTYDGAGNTTSHKKGEVLTWDFRGRLTDVAQDGKALEHYEYGAGEARVRKHEGGSTTVYVTPDYEVRDGAAQIYVTIGDRQLARIEFTDTAAKLLSDVAPAALTTSKATPAPDGHITAGDAWIAQWASLTGHEIAGVTPSSADDLLAAAARSLFTDDPGPEVVTYYSHDVTGSFVAGTDAAGKTIATLVEHPYGTRRFATGGAPEDLRYHGKEIDAVGLVYVGARYAHPQLGRWISPDPEFASITNLAAFDTPDQVSGAYLFLDNDPVTSADDDGRFAHMIVGAVIGATAGIASSLINDLVVEPKKFRGIGGRAQAKIVGKIILKALVKGAIGAVSGGLSGGLSAISTVSSTATQVAVYKYKMRSAAGKANSYLDEHGLEATPSNVAAAKEHVAHQARLSANRWAAVAGVVTGVGVSFGAAAAVHTGAISMLHVNDVYEGTAISTSASAAGMFLANKAGRYLGNKNSAKAEAAHLAKGREETSVAPRMSVSRPRASSSISPQHAGAH